MKSCRWLLVLLMLFAGLAGAQRAVLRELYTSEGCDSCPPADRRLSQFKSLADDAGSPLDGVALGPVADLRLEPELRPGGPLALDKAGRLAWRQEIALDAAWKRADLGLVVFVQDKGSGEILQALQRHACAG